jgi:hypothetical protein
MGEKVEVDGVDYTPEGIRAMREVCIEYREESMNQWPDAIPFTVAMSHVIALLSNYADMVEEAGSTNLRAKE